MTHRSKKAKNTLLEKPDSQMPICYFKALEHHLAPFKQNLITYFSKKTAIFPFTYEHDLPKEDRNMEGVYDCLAFIV